MSENIFYVYELIDPRNNKPFYVGKGSGRRVENYFKEYPRVTEHTKTILEEIAMSGNKLIVKYVKENLSESDAFLLEQELIKKYGRITKDPGGLLTNTRASSKGNYSNVKKNIYTTIQIKKDIGEAIRNFCVTHNFVASNITEKFWINYISSSIHHKDEMLTDLIKNAFALPSMSGSLTI